MAGCLLLFVRGGFCVCSSVSVDEKVRFFSCVSEQFCEVVVDFLSVTNEEHSYLVLVLVYRVYCAVVTCSGAPVM